MKKFIVIIIVLFGLVVGGIYVYVFVFADSTFSTHCEKEVSMHQQAIKHIKLKYKGEEQQKKLNGWKKTEKTIEECVGDIKHTNSYDNLNIINKARFIFATKLLNK